MVTGCVTCKWIRRPRCYCKSQLHCDKIQKRNQRKIIMHCAKCIWQKYNFVFSCSNSKTLRQFTRDNGLFYSFVVCICAIIQICLNFRKSQIIRDLPGVAQLLERLWACGQVCRCSYLCKLGEGGHIWQRFSDASCPIQRSQRESKSHHKRHTWTRQWVRIQNYKSCFIKKDWPSVVYPNHNWMVLRWSIGFGRPV